MTTLVTSATGHLGANLVRALLRRGERVRVMLRSGTSTAPVEGLDVERVHGDLRDGRSLRQAVEGCDRVYHTAALVSLRSRDRGALFETNVLGTRRLLDACMDAGVERVVHTSSFGAVGINGHGPSTEEDLPSPFEPMMDYDRSKIFAEMEGARAALRGLDVTMVNPSGIIGPFDFKPSMMGQTILDFARGRLPAYIPGAFDFVPARDVVEGHIAAMERGRRGERYLLTGEVVSVDTMLSWLEELTGRARPRLRVPPRMMLPVAAVKDRVDARLFPARVPRFNESSIRLLTSGKRGDHGKARRELGFAPGAVKEAFRDAVAWFREQGWIAASGQAPVAKNSSMIPG